MITSIGVGVGLHGCPDWKQGRELAAHRHVLFLRGEGVVVGVGVPGQDAEPACVGASSLVGRALECGCHGTLRPLIGIVGAQSRRRCHQWRCLRWCLLVMLAAWRSSLSVPGTVGRSSSSLAAPDLEGHRTRSTSRHRWPRPNPRSDERQAGNGEVDGSGRGCGGGTAGRTRSRGLSRQGGCVEA